MLEQLKQMAQKAQEENKEIEDNFDIITRLTENDKIKQEAAKTGLSPITVAHLLVFLTQLANELEEQSVFCRKNNVNPELINEPDIKENLDQFLGKDESVSFPDKLKSIDEGYERMKKIRSLGADKSELMGFFQNSGIMDSIRESIQGFIGNSSPVGPNGECECSACKTMKKHSLTDDATKEYVRNISLHRSEIQKHQAEALAKNIDVHDKKLENAISDLTLEYVAADQGNSEQPPSRNLH